MLNNQSMHHPNRCRCNWIVTLILALILLWMLLTGHGPTSACCNAPVEAATPVEEAEPTVTEAFNFKATANDFTSSGDGTKLTWFSQSAALKALLAGGDTLQTQGDDKNVVLTGTVDSDAIKQQKGADAQAFFGSAVTVDNQLLIKAMEPAAVMPPPAAKLYFDTAKTALPGDAGVTLAPIIEWLKTHDAAKAVLSGFHDSRGNEAANVELAKNRAKSVREALKTAGIDEARIEMRKPETVDGGANLNEARRVEVSVE
jgi:outer membrane protein OmpA-like peptidoglycan-associated protein